MIVGVLSISSEFLDLGKHVENCNKKYVCKYCEKKCKTPGEKKCHENIHMFSETVTINITSLPNAPAFST